VLTQSPNLGASAAEVWEKRQTRRPGWAIRETWMGLRGWALSDGQRAMSVAVIFLVSRV